MSEISARNRILLIGTAMALATGASAPAAMAQEGSRFTIEEVVVTARKVEESLQTVPVAVSALTGGMIERAAITDIGDLEGMAPNVEIGRHGTFPSSAHITIRGMTSMDIERSFEPSVGVVVDGLFLASNTNQMVDMFDIGRIEILRGPQGTLFGKNTIGGVVNVVRNQPTNEFEARAQATLGNFGRVDLKGVVNVPLVDNVLAARVGVASLNSDGYIKNLATGNDLNGDDALAIRGALRLTPNENFDFTINYDYYRNRNDGTGPLNLSTPDQAICAFFGYCAVQLPNGKFTDGDRDLYTVNTNSDGFNHEDIHTVVGEFNWRLGDYTLTSITGYRHLKEDILFDPDASTLRFLEPFRYQKSEQFSQELRLSGEIGDRADFVVGAYYFYSDYYLLQITDMTDSAAAFLEQETYHDDKSWAGFFQGNYRITPELRLNVGGRYTWQKKTIDHRPLGYPTFSGEHSETWKEFTPRVGLDYQVNDNFFVYASYAAGFKSGGWNGRAGSFTSLGPYDPEKVDAFEIGFKSDFWSGRGRLNVAAFYNDYKDLQLDTVRPTDFFGGQETLVDNAASAKTQGIEAELTLMPAEGLTLFSNVGYLDAKYKSFMADLDGDGNIDDNTSLKFRRAPKWQVTLGASYEYLLPNDAGSMDFNVRWSWRDKAELTVLNFPVGHQKSVGILNGTVSYTTPNDHIRVSLYGRNLTNEKYIEYVLPVADLFNFGSPSIPREYGIELTFQY